MNFGFMLTGVFTFYETGNISIVSMVVGSE